MSGPSDRQVELIGELLEERETEGTKYAGHTVAPAGLTGGRDGSASAAITELFALPRKGVKHARPGYYVTEDGRMILVVTNRAGTQTYAKELVGTPTENGRTHYSWDYAPGVAVTVADLTPMTSEEAAKFGHLSGRCFKCLRPLTDPKSVLQGMGPVCAKALD